MAGTLLRRTFPTVLSVLFLGLCAPGLSGEPAGEIVRFLCDPTNPEEWAKCTDDSLQVPAPPWEACGPDTTPDGLTCRSFPPCN